MAERRLFKEFNQLQKSPQNPQIISLQPQDEESSIFRWKSVICKPTKQDSPYYYNGQWTLNINVSSQYPITPPKISFDRQTPISHPNIDINTGEICLDILKQENWSPAWNLEHLVLAILILIDDPEPDSPLNIDLANLFRHDKVAFESLVQYMIWKHGTIRDKDSSGIKPSQEIVSDNESETKSISASSNTNSSNTTTSNTLPHPNVEIIQDVGKQITQEFINKVEEIKHDVDSHQHHLDERQAANFDNAKRQIVDNVNRQVKELCLKSVSPESESEEQRNEILQSHQPLEEEKTRFLQEIDNKINMHNAQVGEVKRSKSKSKSERGIDTNTNTDNSNTNTDNSNTNATNTNATNTNATNTNTNATNTNTDNSNSNSNPIPITKSDLSSVSLTSSKKSKRQRFKDAVKRK